MTLDRMSPLESHSPANVYSSSQAYTGLMHTSWKVKVKYITQGIAHTHVHCTGVVWVGTHSGEVLEEKQIVGIPSIHSACQPALPASPLNKHQPPPLWCPLCSHTTMLYKIVHINAMYFVKCIQWPAPICCKLQCVTKYCCVTQCSVGCVSSGATRCLVLHTEEGLQYL